MRIRRERGQGLVEFAVIFPIFAFLIFALVDGGLLMGRYNDVTNGAKEGARLAAVGAPKADIVARVQQQVHGILSSPSTTCSDMTNNAAPKVICVQWIYGPSGELPGQVGSSIRVKVKYKYKILTPLFKVPVLNTGGNPTWNETACAVQRLEQPVSPAAGDKTTDSTDTSC
jgi:hypothetical protein